MEDQGKYQTDNPEEEQPQHSEDQQPKVVTEDMLQKKLDKFWNDVQQMTTKQENRVAQKLAQWEKKVAAAGIVVTPEMKTDAQRSIAMAMLNDEAGDAQPGPYEATRTPNPIAQKVIDDTNAAQAALEEKYDYVMQPTDPEYKTMPWSGLTPEDYLAEYENRLKKILTRRGRQLPEEELPPGSPDARLPAPLGAAARENLMAQYRKEVEQAGTVNERLNIRNKYRERGLEL